MVLCCQGKNQVGVEYLIPLQQWLTRLPKAGSTAIRLTAVSTLDTVTVEEVGQYDYTQLRQNFAAL